MVSLNQLLHSFSQKAGNKYNKIHVQRVIMLNIFSYISLFFLLICSIYSYFSSHSYLTPVLASSFFLIIVNLIYLSRSQKIIFSSLSFLIVIGLTILYVLFKGTYPQVMMWVMLFPIEAVYILGQKKGNRIALFFFGLLLAGFLLSPFFDYIHQYPAFYRLVIIISYLAILLAIYVYESFHKGIQMQLESKVEEAKAVNTETEEFLSKLSHQIRTLLNNIVVVSNILHDSQLNQRQSDLVDTIQASANNLADAINNISELSNVELIEGMDYCIDFDLDSTLTNTFNLFSKQNSDNVTFHLNIPEELKSHLKGNPIHIKQIFLNLVENIIKNKPPGLIKLTVNVKPKERENGDIKINFEIISDKPLQVQYKKSKKQFVTSAVNLKDNKLQKDLIELLDLSTANRLIEAHGSNLNITSEGEQILFSFNYSLSIPTATEQHLDHTPEIQNQKTSDKPSLNEANILLVEDNQINQKIVVLSLKKKVKNIDIANNGKEALNMFGSTRYDIILMDIQLPIMNGIVTTKKIREIEASSNSHTPIIAITANALLGDKEKCLAAGMDDYLSKPFQIEVLIKKMKEQLEKVE